MANDCLVTKLKGVVSNPDLMKLGQCVIKSPNSELDLFVLGLPVGQSVIITPRNGSTIYAAEDIIKDNPGTPIAGPTTITSTKGYYSVYAPNFGEFTIDDFYNKITRIIQGGIPIHVWNYLTNFIDGGVILLASDMYSSKLSTLDKNTLSRVTSVIDFGLIDLDDNIMDYIAACTNATMVYCATYMQPCTAEEFGAVLNTNITRFIGPRGNAQFGGTIEGFVAAQRAKGRTSGSIQWFNGNLTNSVTFDGEPIGNAWDTITWTADTITFLGKTINA